MPAGITPLPPDAKHTRARARRPALDLPCDSAVIPRETRNARGTQGLGNALGVPDHVGRASGACSGAT